MAAEEPTPGWLDCGRRPAAIFWDMDGTLTDSEPLWEQAVYFVSEKMGKRASAAVRERTIGGSIDDTLAILAANAGIALTPEKAASFKEDMLNHVSGLYAENLVLFPGVKELLSGFHADGVPMFVTTNTQRKVAQPVLEAIGAEFFSGSICGDEVQNPKPAPQMYELAALRAGCMPQDCLVFEDSVAGMRAAADAGCVVIGLPADSLLEVPIGVTPIRDLHTGAHLDGATKSDIYAWFASLHASKTVNESI